MIYYILLSTLVSLIFCSANKDKRRPNLPNFFLWMITWPLNLLYLVIILLWSLFILIHPKYRIEVFDARTSDIKFRANARAGRYESAKAHTRSGDDLLSIVQLKSIYSRPLIKDEGNRYAK